MNASDGATVRGPHEDVRRVLFYGKSMARTRCTGALVDALREHGLEVRFRNLARLRRWVGAELALRLARAEFRRYRPDLVFVFFRDLPWRLACEFREQARVVVWCEEALESLDDSVVDYFAQADLVCVSNPARLAWLRERGLDNLMFQMSGFSPRFHRPVPPAQAVRDVAFIGGPGRRGQRAAFLDRVSARFHTEVFGLHWERWAPHYPRLRLCGSVRPGGYAQVCATSRIVLGINECNDDPLYFSNRTFLTLACGGFHLTHHVPGLERVFTDGEHLVWFRSEDEAMELLAAWLQRDVRRAQVAASGHDFVLRHHRYYHRVSRILEQLRRGRGADVAAAVPFLAPAAGAAGRPSRGDPG